MNCDPSEIKSAIRLHSTPGQENTAKEQTVIEALLLAGYSHVEIEEALDHLTEIGEIYYVGSERLGVV